MDTLQGWDGGRGRTADGIAPLPPPPHSLPLLHCCWHTLLPPLLPPLPASLLGPLLPPGVALLRARVRGASPATASGLLWAEMRGSFQAEGADLLWEGLRGGVRGASQAGESGSPRAEVIGRLAGGVELLWPPWIRVRRTS